MNFNVTMILQVLMALPAFIVVLAIFRLAKVRSVPGTGMLLLSALVFIAGMFLVEIEGESSTLVFLIIDMLSDFIPVLLFALGFYRLAGYAAKAHLTSKSIQTPKNGADV